MIQPSRIDPSLFGRWWWTVDRWMLLSLLVLSVVGILMVMAASPAVANRLGLEPFHFVWRQSIYFIPALVALIFISFLSPLSIRRVALAGFLIALITCAATPLIGHEVNGASRWLRLGSFVLQPSEFVKPTLVVVTGWMLSERHKSAAFPGNAIAATLVVVVLAILIAQPDFGMAVLVAVVFFVQLLVAGLAAIWIAILAAIGLMSLLLGYLFLPHVAARIDRFLDPSSGDSYQVDKALEAFSNGGVLGRGPGEGVVKFVLPDAHSDFIFAVIGEEFGLFASLAIVALFSFIVLRGFLRLLHEQNLFILLSASGLLTQFGMQVLVNMGVNLRLLPAKGMTLPFISYGGSSLLALAFAMGMVLGLTRKHTGRGFTI